MEEALAALGQKDSMPAAWTDDFTGRGPAYMQTSKLLLSTSLAAALSFAAPLSWAAQYNLDFSSGIANTTISQNFGDSAEADVSYRIVQSFGNSTLASGELRHWKTGYGDLTGVAWSTNSSSRGEIRIQSLDSQATVTLNGFDLATYGATARQGSWRVFDLSWNLLPNGSGSALAPVGKSHLDVDLAIASVGGLILQWGDNPGITGINNVSFSVSAPVVHTPLPPALLLLAPALGGLAMLRRRKT